MPSQQVVGNAADSAAEIDRAVLPAGVYFRTALSCPGCPMPTVVAIRGVFDDGPSAKAAADELRDIGLSPGYPFFAHTRELGVADAKRGIAVVVAMFEARTSAEQWSVVHDSVPVELVTLLDEETMFGREASLVPDEDLLRAVEIHAGPGTPAYSAASIEAMIEDESAAPVLDCQVEGRSLFLATADEIMRHLYAWAPVECGSHRAYVRWADTRLWSTVKAEGSGHRLLQIVGASHEGLVLAEWDYAADGSRRFLGNRAPAPRSARRDDR
jgi:hypothetical protein